MLIPFFSEICSSQARANFSLEGYAYYLGVERRRKNPDMFVLKALYERAIAEAAKRRFVGEPTAEEALRSFWIGYVDVLVSKASCLQSPGSSGYRSGNRMRKTKSSYWFSGEVCAAYRCLEISTRAICASWYATPPTCQATACSRCVGTCSGIRRGG